MAANDKEVLVKADHVKVYFKGKKRGQTVKAVDDVSFEIMKGETFGVVGESGCGKSTLGRTLIRLQQPTDGHIYLNGTDIAGLKGAQLKEMRKEAQIIFQDPSACLNPRRTIKQILMEPFEIHNLKGKIDVDAKIMELLQLVGLDSYHLSRYPHELSGGMKQRVMIAIALVSRPSVIICDEPTTSLDVTIEAQILDLLLELREKLGTSIIMITHDLGVISRLCDRVVVMYGGKIVEKGEIGEIFYNTAHPYTKGLMQSIAKLDTAKGEKLKPIEGTPPDLFAPPKGCPFAARCEYCMDVCEQLPPEAYTVADDHTTFCWLQHEMAPETDLKKATAKKGEV